VNKIISHSPICMLRWKSCLFLKLGWKYHGGHIGSVTRAQLGICFHTQMIKKRQLFHLSIQIGEWDMILFTKRCYIFFIFWHSIWPLNVYSCDWVFTQKFTEANWLFSMGDWEPSEALLLVLCRLWFSVFVSKNDFTMGKSVNFCVNTKSQLYTLRGHIECQNKKKI
jgi:hypothetical protein